MPGVISISTNNSERDRKRVHVERKKIRLDQFFSLICPPKKEGTFIQGQNSSATLKKQQVMRQHVKQRDFFFFLNWKHVVDVVVLLLWHHLVFRSVEYQRLLWRKQRFYHFGKSGLLPMVKKHVNSHFSLFYVAYLAAIYLGNPLPPHVKKYDLVLSI